MTRRKASIAVAIVAAVGILPVLVLLAIPCPPLLEDQGFSRAFLDREGRLLRLTLAPDERYRLFVPLDRVSPALVDATLLQEDRHFRAHPGFNPVSLVRGAWRTFVAGPGRSGGSTLTMQLARLRFRLKTRTPWGKLVQVVRAVQIELHHSKREILEAYLNLAPYGRNIEGAEAASLVYFGKTADRLTLTEAMALCQLPRRPNPGGRPEAWRAFLQAGRAALFDRWVREHPGDADLGPDVALPIALRSPRDLPFRAPHLVDDALRDLPTGIGPAASGEVRTTLDLGLQDLVERRLTAYIGQVRPRGIENAAVLVADARTLEVVALAGSADHGNAAIHGQVNGARAPRSPGSALKPFVYALAIDRGLIHPRTLLDDAPMSFGEFNPENFDRDFLGPIPAVDALVHSRNLPAVELASRLPPSALHDLLAAGGLKHLGSAARHGLALVLGGVEVSMEELVSLYAMLARGGVWAPLRKRLDAPRAEGVRLLGREASLLTVWMLRQNPRPGRGYAGAAASGGAEVAWKTGTSAGFRDAWSVGIAGPYVVAVWAGNFDGRRNRALVGREAAAPLMFDLVDAIRARDPSLPDLVPPEPPPDANVTEVEVCAVTGRLPNPACPHRTRTWFIPGTSPIDTCALHRAVDLDVRTGLRACPGQGGAVRREVFEFWPSDALALFRRAGVPRRVPPPYAADCPLARAGEGGMPPRIQSPRPGSTYVVRVGQSTGNDLPLRATSEAGVRTLYWFLDDRYLGAWEPGDGVSWPLAPGRHVARVVDDRGRADERAFRVRVEAGVSEAPPGS